MAKPKPIGDAELRAITDLEMRNAMAYLGGKLSEARRKALYYYEALPKGDLAPPAIEGRSQVVSTDVLDTVEWMLPGLLKIFTAGDNAVEFTPQGPEDEESAKQATDYVNYIFYRQNPGFKLLYTAIKDALLQRTGVLKVCWDRSTEDVREEYRGLTDDELAMLLQDEVVEAIEHTEYPAPMAPTMPGQPQQPPAMLHDVTVKRTVNKGRVRIDAVPPEEFLISRRAIDLETAPFVAHRVERTISQLRAAGYKNVEDITSDDAQSYNSERLERMTWDDEQANIGSGMANQASNADPSGRVVWITECYMQVDVDGDGIAEWRKIVRAGNALLGDPETGATSVKVDGHPFVVGSVIIQPHRFFGLSAADLAMPSQKEKTAIKRAVLDNMYLQVNGRTWAVDGQVNIDDLLTSRPGGVVRVKSPTAVGPLQTGMGDMAGAMSLLEYTEQEKENRTGFTRYSQGTNADALNQTATGMNIITNRADGRIELMARSLAETLVKELFRKILKLVCQYQDQAQTIRINGKWVNIDPRAWKNQFDMTINVGLGTGNKDQIVQHLMVLAQAAQQAAPLGVVSPKNVYEMMGELCDALGFGKKKPMLLTDPTTLPPQPPPPDPKMVEAQSRMQLEQAKFAAQQQLDQQRMAGEIEKEQIKAQLAQAQMAQDFELEKIRIATDAQVKLAIAEMQAQSKASLDAITTHINGMGKEISAKINPSNTFDTVILPEIERFRAMFDAPRQIIRDPSGNPVGVSVGDTVRNVIYDDAGEVVGLA